MNSAGRMETFYEQVVRKIAAGENVNILAEERRREEIIKELNKRMPRFNVQIKIGAIDALGNLKIIEENDE